MSCPEAEVRTGRGFLGSSGLHCGDGPIRCGDEGGAVAAGSILGVDSSPWRRSAHHRYNVAAAGAVSL